MRIYRNITLIQIFSTIVYKYFRGISACLFHKLMTHLPLYQALLEAIICFLILFSSNILYIHMYLIDQGKFFKLYQ